MLLTETSLCSAIIYKRDILQQIGQESKYLRSNSIRNCPHFHDSVKVSSYLVIVEREKIEKVKAPILKRDLGAGKNVPSRMLTRGTFYLEYTGIRTNIPGNKSIH